VIEAVWNYAVDHGWAAESIKRSEAHVPVSA